MQVGHLLVPGLEQLLGGQGRAAAGMAHHHQRPAVGELAAAGFQLGQGDQQTALHPAIGAGELLAGAHVQHGELIAVGGHPGRQQFRQSGVAALQWRPAGGWQADLQLVARLAGTHVAGQGLGDAVGVGQLHVLHVAHEVALGGCPAQAGVEGLLLSHRRDGAAGVVVARIEQAGVGKAEELPGDRAPQAVGVALLEVAAAAAPHQQGVAGEGHAPVVEHEADAAIGVSRGAAHLQEAAAEGHMVAVLQRQGHVLGPGGGGEADGAAGGLVHQPAAGHVVGVGVGVDRGHQLHPQLADQGEVAGVLLEHRVDQHALAAGHIHQQVGEGAGFGIEELAEQQAAAAGGGVQGNRGQEGGGDGRRCSSHDGQVKH